MLLTLQRHRSSYRWKHKSAEQSHCKGKHETCVTYMHHFVPDAPSKRVRLFLKHFAFHLQLFWKAAACPFLFLQDVLQENCAHEDPALQSKTWMRWKGWDADGAHWFLPKMWLQQVLEVHVKRDSCSSRWAHLLGALSHSGSWAGLQCKEDAGQAITSSVLPPSGATFAPSQPAAPAEILITMQRFIGTL